MKTYTKREFLKILGLGIVFIPFVGCYNNSSNSSSSSSSSDKDSIPDSGLKAITDTTEEDILLLTRDDEKYAQFNASFNGRIHKLPKYIAVCKTTAGIQHAVKLAAKQGLAIAIKSGGHSFEGFSGNDGGMVINLSQMKKISWEQDGIVQIEPGCTLSEIQAELFAKNKLLPAGSCGSVGIAGLTLGGGYGFFSRKFGLTCDSLLDVEMISSDGNVLQASTDESSLWACKGGGNGNFGVISKFKFNTYEMPKTFSSFTLKFRHLEADRFYDLLASWFAFSQEIAAEDFSAFVLNGTTLTLLATTFKAPATLENKLRGLIQKSASSSKSIDKNLPQSMKRYYGRKGPILFKNASAGLFQGFSDLEKIAKEIFEKVVAHNGIIFQINTLGGAINSAQLESQSCYPHRALPYLGELQAYWDKPEQEHLLTTAFEEIQQLIAANGVKAHYRNYPDINFKDWQHAYYGNNYEALQKIKKKYDPQNLFKYPQSILPA